VVRDDDAVDPVLAASLASRRLWMPLSRIGPSQFARMSGSCFQLRPGFWKTPANAMPAGIGATSAGRGILRWNTGSLV